MVDVSTTSNACGAGAYSVLIILWVAVTVVMLASTWIIFRKAGRPGWGSLIPIFNTYLMLKIAGKPGWWLFLFLIPLVNLIIGVIMMIQIAQNFGKGSGFAVGMILLPIVFFPILAFGDAKYIGESAAAIGEQSGPPAAQ